MAAHLSRALYAILMPLVPAAAINLVVVKQELEDGWTSIGMTLEEALRVAKARLLKYQRDYMVQHAEQTQQRTLLTILGQQAAAASSSARVARVSDFYPPLPLPPPATAGQSSGSRPGSRQGSPGRVHNVCDSWRKTQSCPRGPACRFAASHTAP